MLFSLPMRLFGGGQEERKYFESFVSNSIRHYAVHAKGFEIRDTFLTPLPVLSLDTTLDGKPILSLSFRYDDKTLYPANKKTAG